MSPAAAPRSRVPTLRHERRLLREGHALVAGMDEVGRGALAGPVSVGVVVIDAGIRSAPTGVRDSKLLTPAARQALVPRLRRWAVAWAVGHAEPDEIDRYGIIASLRLAGRRALATLPDLPTCVLLDGSHDWLSPPRPRPGVARGGVDAPALFDLPAGTAPPVAPPTREPAPAVPLGREPTVRTMIKADLRCAAVAAASVLAKVERDAVMVERAQGFPVYGWECNKGYSAPGHLAALAGRGPCEQHRRSWSLPGVADEQDLALDLSDPSELPDPSELSELEEGDPFDVSDDGQDDGLQDEVPARGALEEARS